MKLLIKNIHVIDPQSTLNCVTNILAENDVIIGLGNSVSNTKDADVVIDGESRLYCFPGLMDMHVHLRDPGFTYKETIQTGAEAAKAGGFTSVACMPNTKPPCDCGEIVKYIIDKGNATGINIFPVGCVTKGMLGQELCDYKQMKAYGAKMISDDGRPVGNAELMRQALEQSNTNGMLVASHCEDLNIINGGIINKGEVSKKLGVKGMDRASEDSITAREIALAMSCNSRIHICHVSTKGSVDIIRAAKKDGVRVTCETCPHYFTFTEDKLLSRDADYRMSPPLRTEADRKAVEEAVIDGTIDCIVTDHAPHSAEDKADFEKAPNGVVGLETSLAATLTQLYHTGKCNLSKIAALMACNPRKIVGAEDVRIAVGSSCDLCIFDPDLEWKCEPEKLHSKSKNSVFKGCEFKGRVLYTICKGKVVYKLNTQK